jgi:hypothetical protein
MIFISQGLQLNSSHETTIAVACFGALSFFEPIRCAWLSEKDFVITYAIVDDINENIISRVLKARAEGAIFNARTQELLITFNLATRESRMLSKDKSVIPQSCVATALAELSDDLTREMSFVLALKILFLQQDRVVTDTADSGAIKNRLSAGTAHKPVPKAITTDFGNYDMDVARLIDIEVYLDFDSSASNSRAIEQIKLLGEALSSTDIGAGRYHIIGHTNAK